VKPTNKVAALWIRDSTILVVVRVYKMERSSKIKKSSNSTMSCLYHLCTRVTLCKKMEMHDAVRGESPVLPPLWVRQRSG